jgi:hypothetical protein
MSSEHGCERLSQIRRSPFPDRELLD